jgi:hypothetical protein
LKRIKSVFVLFLSLALIVSATGVRSAPKAGAFSQGGYFNYHEVETVANGTGSYAGYTDQSVVTGGEHMNGVSGSTVSANYSYSYSFSDNQGSSTASSVSGSYTWSDSTFLYLTGTDNEQGYINPTVWFAMNSALPIGGTFVLLDTQMTMVSKNYTYYLPTENQDVTTIFAQGSGSYIGSPEDNAYGNFTAQYTWNVYFDPITGYIVGYHYVEQDVSPNGNGTGFGYTDDLYVTSTSYPLTVVCCSTTLTNISTSSSAISSAPTSVTSTALVDSTTSIASSTVSSQSTSSNSGTPSIDYIAVVAAIVVVVGIVIYDFYVRRKSDLSKSNMGNPPVGT